MNIELSGINVLLSIGLLFVLLIILIVGMRAIFRARKINAFKQIGLHFRLGLITALAFVLLSFSWTTYDQVDNYVFEVFDGPVEVEIPRTDHPKPKPPPPPPPVKIEVPDEIIPDEEELEFVDDSVEDDDEVNYEPISEPEVKEIPLPPAPPPVEIEVSEIFEVVEQMPRFPGCESMEGTNKEKRACADEKLLNYIYKNLKYPQIALETGIQGTVAIQFVVDKEGKIESAEIVREIGGGCGAAVLKLVKDMNTKIEAWTPGKQRGRNVKVKYTLPIKFKMLN